MGIDPIDFILEKFHEVIEEINLLKEDGIAEQDFERAAWWRDTCDMVKAVRDRVVNKGSASK